MLITYPLFTVTDDSGAVVAGATVAITSVKDRDGADVATPGAAVHQSGANVSVAYDAELKGEAWVVLAVSKAGSTFTGLNAAPAFFLSKDPSRVEANLDAPVSGVSTGGVSAAVIAAAVLDELLAGHATAGSLGKAVADVAAALASADGYTPRQSLALILSAVAAQLSGVPASGSGGTVLAKAANAPGTTRISWVVDGNGNRTGVTFSPPA